MPTIELDLQNPAALQPLPAQESFELWVGETIEFAKYQPENEQPVELTIRVSDESEARQLNNTYRQKDYATNVLSFPADAPEEIPINLLGDLVICANIVTKEAREQHKTAEAHWAHLTIHGTLHLLGYDHIEDVAADEMENLETTIMLSLGYNDPYTASPET